MKKNPTLINFMDYLYGQGLEYAQLIDFRRLGEKAINTTLTIFYFTELFGHVDKQSF